MWAALGSEKDVECMLDALDADGDGARMRRWSDSESERLEQ